MDVEDNKSIVLRYFLESHNAPYNWQVIDELMSAELAAGIKAWQQMERAALPDKHFTVEDVVAEGDKVVLRWTINGTHLGEFTTPAGIALPTGNHITLTTIVIYRLEDGKIVGQEIVIDWLELLRQFGAEVSLPT